jgi:hypothetical protein
MKIRIAAAFALTAASSLHAQTATTTAPTLSPAGAPTTQAAAPTPDLSTTAPIDGNWAFATQPGGSAATFTNSTGMPQVTVTCVRASRQVTISRPATGVAPFLLVWSSDKSRNLPASYTPANGRLSATLGAYDALLDGMAFSRGRLGFSALNMPMLVVPAWPEVARVVEDCRA